MGPDTSTPLADFALLAPVPWCHLDSGRRKARAEGLGFIAFGSGPVKEQTSMYSLEFFRRVDEERRGRPVVMLIYPSLEQDEPKPPYLVEWTGLYTGHITARADGLHPDGWKYRPDSCRDNHLAGLAREEWVALGT